MKSAYMYTYIESQFHTTLQKESAYTYFVEERKNTNKWNERTKMLCKMSIEIYFGQDRTYMHIHYTSMYEPSTEVYA